MVSRPFGTAEMLLGFVAFWVKQNTIQTQEYNVENSEIREKTIMLSNLTIKTLVSTKKNANDW